jgi:hypothetical protein
VWCWDFEYVPSLHFAVAPAGSVLLAATVGADADDADLAAEVAAGDDADAVPAGGGVAGGAAGAAAALAGGAAAAGAAGVDDGAGVAGDVAVLAVFAAFTVPPWRLQAPRPVAVEVVPSLQVVVGAAAGAASSA